MEHSKRKRGRKTKKAVAETMDFQMAASGAPSPSALDEPQEIPDSASPKPRRGRGRPKKATRRQNLAPADSPASSPIRRGSQVVAINGEHGESGLAVVSLDPPPRWDQVVRVVPSMDAVVKVFCVHTEPNFSLPWQRKRQYSSSSSGFIIGGRRVLTNAHSVEHYTQVKLKKRGSDTKYVATVLAIGTECDIGKIRRLSFMTYRFFDFSSKILVRTMKWMLFPLVCMLSFLKISLSGCVFRLCDTVRQQLEINGI